MEMKVVVKLGLPVLVLLLAGYRTGHLYPAAGNSAVLVKPSFRVWTKPGSTMEDETRARKECREELRSDKELRKKGLSNEWSAAFHSCMQRKGFRHYKD